jgi:hypothetical protein
MILLIGLLFFSTLPLHTAGALPTVRIVPAWQRVGIDSVATVVVRIDSISHVRVYSIRLRFDPGLLRCERIEKLTFFPPGGSLFFSAVDSLGGVATVDEAILGVHGLTGSGDLFRVSFRGRRNGLATLQFERADFRDTANATISVNRQGGEIRVGNPNSVAVVHAVRSQVSLLSAYPNPFNSSTTIVYGLPCAGDVEMIITNLPGQTIKTLRLGDQGGGMHRVLWNGTDNRGRGVPSGVYLVRITSRAGAGTVKLQYVK